MREELLKLIRRVRDAEREAIASVYELLAEDGQMLSLQDLPRALVELRWLVFFKIKCPILVATAVLKRNNIANQQT